MAVTELTDLVAWLRSVWDEPIVEPPLRLHSREQTPDHMGLGSPEFSHQFVAYVERFEARSSWHPCASVAREEQTDCHHPGYPKASLCPYCQGFGYKGVWRSVYLRPLAAALWKLRETEHVAVVCLLASLHFDAHETIRQLGAETHLLSALRQVRHSYMVGPMAGYRGLSEAQAIAEAAA